MARSLVTLAVLLGSTLAALAAVPPQYQRQRELEAVLSTAVRALGRTSLVERVEMIGTDTWLVTGNGCHVVVRVVDAPRPHAPGWTGPREISTVAEPVACK